MLGGVERAVLEDCVVLTGKTIEKQTRGKLSTFLADGHERLEYLLRRTSARPGKIEANAYGESRSRHLKHIAMEEKILLPAAQRARGGKPLSIAAKLRLDHSALAALLVPPPTPKVVAALEAILRDHNQLEEGPGGLYETCEKLIGSDVEAILLQFRAAPEVPVRPHLDGPEIMEATRRALARSGYDLKEQGILGKEVRQ